MRVYGARDGIAKAYHGRWGSSWSLVRADGGNDNCGAIWDGNMLGEIRAAVERLPAPFRQWAEWCYTDGMAQNHYDACEQIILDDLIRRYDARPPVAFSELGAMRPASRLMYMAMRDTRQRERNGRALYNYARLAAEAGIAPSDMYPGRRWRLFYNCIDGHLNNIIADTLMPVAEVVDKINLRRAA